ncbi:helix-turn-helix domain-containing protein [Candidatus Microgenomates bacterium]|nr:helix-turn-helix domain-containing protein [Candidatus Microgenomates bacterium]
MSAKETQPEINRFLPDHPVNRIRLVPTGEVVTDNRRVSTTPTETKILARLLANPFGVMIPDAFTEVLFGGVSTRADRNTAAVNVGRLNEKLKTLKVRDLKIRHEGKGYTFVSNKQVRGLIDRGSYPESVKSRMSEVDIQKEQIRGKLILLPDRLMAKSPINNRWVNMTRSYSAILERLISYHDTVVEHQALIPLLESGILELFRSEKKRLAVNIKRVRQKLGISPDNENSLIVTVRGRGYMLVTK